MTAVDDASRRVRHESHFHGATAPFNAAWSPAPRPVPIAGTCGRCPGQYWTLERIRVREQAAELVAAVGPAALEIIADFRARRWTVTAAHWKDTAGGELARIRADEWHRIATSVSTLMAL